MFVCVCAGDRFWNNYKKLRHFSSVKIEKTETNKEEEKVESEERGREKRWKAKKNAKR